MLVSDTDKKLTAFENAMEFLISVTHKTCEQVSATPDLLRQVATLLNETKRHGNLVHITGMGRSFRSAMAIGEMLKDKGFEISYPGKTLARPIHKNDIILAVSGSGWTQTTLYHVEAGILRGAKVISMTGHERSKLGRLSDSVIKIPGVKEVPKEWSYIQKQLNGKRSPLAPMGTVNELSAMLVGIGLAVSVDSETINVDFTRVTDRIIAKTRQVQRSLEQDQQVLEDILNIYRDLTTTHGKPRPTAYFIGAGLSGLVAHMAAMRFQHLGVKVRQNYDWRFRKSADVITILSGSGETRVSRDYAEMAKKAGMKIIGITAFPDSSLSKQSDYSLNIPGRAPRTSQFESQIQNIEPFIPTFEYAVAVILDSIVAQLAYDFEIDEEQMLAEHTNVE